MLKCCTQTFLAPLSLPNKPRVYMWNDLMRKLKKLADVSVMIYWEYTHGVDLSQLHKCKEDLDPQVPSSASCCSFPHALSPTFPLSLFLLPSFCPYESHTVLCSYIHALVNKSVFIYVTPLDKQITTIAKSALFSEDLREVFSEIVMSMDFCDWVGGLEYF